MASAQHNEWLALVEVSGPFLSLPVLNRVFPHGLEPHDPEVAKDLRGAYSEWDFDARGRRPSAALNASWVRYVLEQVLDLPKDLLKEGQAIPPGLEARVAELGETLRPDLVLVNPPDRDGGRPRLLVQIVPAGQNLDKPLEGARWKASLATRMMTLLQASGVRLGLVTNGEQWMLVYSPQGETTTYCSWFAALWLEEKFTLQAFRTLLGRRRFYGVQDSEGLLALLEESAQNQQEVTDQLGYQVRRAVEMLVHAIDREDRARDRNLLAGVEEKTLCQAALTVMMRLVFLFSAEERGLLLLGDPLYDQNYAVSTLRAQLREAADQHGEDLLERRQDAWCRLLATFRAVHGGVQHDRLTLPAYGGELFDPDRFPFLEGRPPGTEWRKTPAEPLPIHNRTVLHLLEALQVLQGNGPTEARRLSFRSLDIEQIGHVYEGLLDHTVKRAEGPVVGLVGRKGQEPEVALSELEGWKQKSESELVTWLVQQTGRTANALRNLLAPGLIDEQRLLVACEGDEELRQRVRPFAGLIREDDNGYSVVIPAGSAYVTQGTDRRSTGTHYTPRSLTEPIVQYALEPQVYEGPAEGWPKEQWKLKPAAALLDLKVCDFAMGSGAFLVQACRYLAERLVESWEEAEARAGGRVVVTPEGELSTGAPDERPLPHDAEERLALARRIVADRCLYGVDRNDIAVEMAKLSLWLITLAKGKPFSFLDHHLKHGDSLVGTYWREGLARPVFLPAEIPDEAFNAKPDDDRTVARSVRDRNAAERAGQSGLFGTGAAGLDGSAYRKLADTPDTPEGMRERERQYKALRRNRETQARLAAADLWAAAWFWPLRGPEGLRAPTTELYREVLERGRIVSEDQTHAINAIRARIPFFHWSVEFPDVFAQGGFDAIVGNPPFLGGQRITGTLGDDYREYLVHHLAGAARGSADLCSYFFLRARTLLRTGGTFGLVATNTIAQGDTREVGLDQILNNGMVLPRAVQSRKWPGGAALEVAHLWGRSGGWSGEYVLDDRHVHGITSFLTVPGAVTGTPFRLTTNEGKSFQGSIVLGLGFVLMSEEAQVLMRCDPHNRDVVLPYLNGDDLNSRPDQSPSRWVINFFDWPLNRSAPGSWSAYSIEERLAAVRAGTVPEDYDGMVASDYPACLQIVEQRVKPERMKLKGRNPIADRRAERWWLFGGDAKKLYASIRGLDRVLSVSRHTKYVAHSFVSPACVFDVAVNVIIDRGGLFPVLDSSFFDAWVRTYGSSLENRVRYTNTDCFETYPFPLSTGNLAQTGERYHKWRTHLSLSRSEGLTQVLNRYHNPRECAEDIGTLRNLHVEMDSAVAAAYGWTDMDLSHGFHDTKQGVRFTISEAARREVLARLLKLNHERYAEEVAQGLHDTKKPKAKAAKTVSAKPETGSLPGL